MALKWIRLTSGRVIELRDLHLSLTYGGLLEGRPTEDVNRSVVDHAVRKAELAHPGWPVHVVPPVCDYPDVPPDSFGSRAETMPSVTCVGWFEDTAIAPDADPAWGRSWLTVVWFQAEASLDGIEAVLSGLAWDELAQDGEL